MAASSNNIYVAVRVRPAKNEAEIEEWIVNEKVIYASRSECVEKVFAFERVFTQGDSNGEVYDQAVQPVVASVVAGYNATVLVYGGESSGKTHTMMGCDDDPGMIRRAIEQIFDEIHKASHREFMLRVSYLEINEKRTQDLLSCSSQIEDTSKELVATIADPFEKVAAAKEDMLQYLAEGGRKMDDRSTRSHSIFRITIESSGKELKEKRTFGVRVSSLNLVDLAGGPGSTALEIVVQRLSSGSENVNCRSSKLTEILQDSLGGNGLAVFICNISPSEYEPTLSTLRFASNAKRIKNRPIINLVQNEDASLLLKRDEKIQTLTSLISRVDFGKEQLLHEKEDTIVRLRRKIESLKKLSARGEPFPPVLPPGAISSVQVSAARNGIHDHTTQGFEESAISEAPPGVTSFPDPIVVVGDIIGSRCAIETDDSVLSPSGARKRRNGGSFSMLGARTEPIVVDGASVLEDESEEETVSSTKRRRSDPSVASPTNSDPCETREGVQVIHALVQTEAGAEKVEIASQVAVTTYSCETQTPSGTDNICIPMPVNRKEVATQTEGSREMSDLSMELQWGRAPRVREESEMIEIQRDSCELSEQNDEFVEWLSFRGLNSDESECQSAFGDQLLLTREEDFEVRSRHSWSVGSETETHQRASTPCRRRLRSSVNNRAESPNLVSGVEENEEPSAESETINEPTGEVTDANESNDEEDSPLSESDQSHHRRMPSAKKLDLSQQSRIPIDQPKDLREQRKTRRRRKPSACDNREKTFPERSNLMADQRTHASEKPFACDICGKTFAHSGHLNRHRRTHTGERPFAYDICVRKFIRSDSLKEHRRIHTGEKPFACDICRKEFTNSGTLYKHRGTHTGEKPFACDVCEKKFCEASNLRKHRRTHTGEKPFACDICETTFAQTWHLNYHRRIHTGERPFACDICDKKFIRSGSLKEHRRIHTGEKPFACDICKKGFTQSGTFHRHRRTHTGEKPGAKNLRLF